MSLYNMLFGQNPAAGILTSALSLDTNKPEDWDSLFEAASDKWGEFDPYSEKGSELIKKSIEAKYYPTGRFRDIFYQHEEGSDPKIVLYTRNGGGNRDYYQWVFDLLSKHPLYIQDYDDDFDCTYAYIEFKAPIEIINFFSGIKTGRIDTVSDKFKKEIQAMENGKEPNRDVLSVLESITKAFE